MMDDAMMPIGRVKRLEINQMITYLVHYPDLMNVSLSYPPSPRQRRCGQSLPRRIYPNFEDVFKIEDGATIGFRMDGPPWGRIEHCVVSDG